MLTVSETWQRIDSLVPRPAETETVPLMNTLGRILRETISCPTDQPAWDRSSIDGFVAALDAPVGALLPIVGDIPAGQAAPPPLAPATALRLFTGSAIPARADAGTPLGLVMQEDATPSPDGLAVVFHRAPSAALIRPRGSQARQGDVLLPAGTLLGPGALALLASVGHGAPLVGRRLRVAHLVTGGELVPPDETPAPGQIRDSNSTLVAALLSAHSADVVAHARAGEGFEETSAAFGRLLAASPDLLLVSGGSSGGAHDHAARVFAEHGFSIAVNQVASRPGKPLLVARRGACLAFGLPGNPLSHFVCFHLFVARALARLAGREPAPLLRLPLAPGAALRVNPRETWWPASRTPDGYAPLPWADSSDLTVLARTHALLRVPSQAAPENTADGILV